MPKKVIEIRNLSKLYRLGEVGTGSLGSDLHRWWSTNILRKEDPYAKVGQVNDRSKAAATDYVWALKDVDLDVYEGDVVGIIGANGAGKSTLLKLISRITSPTTGHIHAKGRIASLLEVGTGMHPDMTARENIYLNGSILGMTRAEINAKFDEIVDFAGVAMYVDTPVKRFSSGMSVRLGFAVAAFLEPEILIVDEVLAVGDFEFQKKAIGKMKDISKGLGRTVLFVSHNMKSVEELCLKGVVLSEGSTIFQGNQLQAIDKYVNTSVSSIDQFKLNKRQDRKGSGQVKFIDFQILDKNGDLIDYVETNSSFRIKLKYQILDEHAKYLNRINVSVSLKDLKNNRVFNFSTSLYDQLITLEDLKNKESINLDVKDFPVLPGEYILNFSMIQGFTYIDGFNEGFRLKVKEKDQTVRNLITRPEDGSILLNGTWNII